MSSPSSPRLFVAAVPELGPADRRVTVACGVRRSALAICPPTDRYLTEALPYLKAAALYAHESDHPGCDTERLWSEHGLERLRACVDRLWDRLGAAELRGRRN